MRPTSLSLSLSHTHTHNTHTHTRTPRPRRLVGSEPRVDRVVGISRLLDRRATRLSDQPSRPNLAVGQQHTLSHPGSSLNPSSFKRKAYRPSPPRRERKKRPGGVRGAGVEAPPGRNSRRSRPGSGITRPARCSPLATQRADPRCVASMAIVLGPSALAGRPAWWFCPHTVGLGSALTAKDRAAAACSLAPGGRPLAPPAPGQEPRSHRCLPARSFTRSAC